MSHVKWKDVSTRTIDVGGVHFVYRELGPDSGVPVIFLRHLMRVLDGWDPRVVDGIAANLGSWRARLSQLTITVAPKTPSKQFLLLRHQPISMIRTSIRITACTHRPAGNS